MIVKNYLKALLLSGLTKKKNIEFDIKNKSINGYVKIKAESLNDLNQLQVDLAENLNVLKIVYDNKELDFVVLDSGLLITSQKKARSGWERHHNEEKPMAIWEWWKD